MENDMEWGSMVRRKCHRRPQCLEKRCTQ
ncbi:hypothetical protein HaLaN_26399, partial [Haematococcus lacustris]